MMLTMMMLPCVQGRIALGKYRRNGSGCITQRVDGWEDMVSRGFAGWLRAEPSRPKANSSQAIDCQEYVEACEV